MRAEIKGFVFKYDEDDIVNLWNKYNTSLSKHIRGDYLITLRDPYKTIYISDFVGSRSSSIPRNCTMIIKENKIAYYKENVSTTELLYSPPQGIPKRPDYDRLFMAIENAVKIRVPDDKFSLALSSGNDSGTIAAALLNQKLQDRVEILYAYGNENRKILDKRLAMFPHTREFNEDVLLMKIEADTIGSVESHTALASNTNTKVLLSGLGADELYVSNDWQLLGEFLEVSEAAHSHFGIDVRYPLCDPLVYREYKLLEHALSHPPQKKKPFQTYIRSSNMAENKGEKSSFYLW